MRRVLVLGGNRSGKSAFAETLLAGAGEVDYVAPAAVPADDPEWAERVRAHQKRRPPTWRTIETADVAGLFGAAGPPVFVDSITSWLARTMDECDAWSAPASDALDGRVAALAEAWAATPRFAVAVSDEVGGGIVPATFSGRRFRDALGLLNQRLAAAAGEVHLVVAGLPLRLK